MQRILKNTHLRDAKQTDKLEANSKQIKSWIKEKKHDKR